MYIYTYAYMCIRVCMCVCALALCKKIMSLSAFKQDIVAPKGP